ncbi:MAG: sigma-70 family RNA polymerase sigma factor [Chloroflexota bacterium]|nr:sigma-70 family RNA polymerase sigma factor [Chloroflexota bacterium]
MTEHDWLAERFEAQRPHLRAIAYRMLGASGEADDAVQESWLRLSRAGSSGVENLGGWLTTVVGRVCLDMLRSRKSRREEPFDDDLSGPPGGVAAAGDGSDPEAEAVLADSVGLALLVVLDTLTPAERLAFVLHDLFAVPFDEIAPIVGRSPDAARQLASRARHRVRGPATVSGADLARQREVVGAFLAASREGDFDALLAVLDPDVVRRADIAGSPEVRGMTAVAEQALGHSGQPRFTRLAIVDGTVGVIVAPGGRLGMALRFVIAHGSIVEIDVITDPARLRRLDLAVLDA